MKADEEFSDSAHPRLFSYFEETFKSPSVTAWLGWIEAEGRFSNLDRLHEFYAWIVPNAENDDPKLPQAKSLRDLATIIADDHAMAMFRAEGGTLTRALARFDADHPEEWYPKIIDATAAIRTLTSTQLKKLSLIEVKYLAELKELIEVQLQDRQTLLGSESNDDT